MQNCFDRFQGNIADNMFVDGRFSQDVALEKVDCLLGPKLSDLNPPLQVPILSNDWSPSSVSIKKIDLSRWEGSDKFCVLLQNILSREECQHLVELSERRGYEKALVNAGGGQQYLSPSTRNNDRCIYDDSQLTEQIWQRVLKATAEKDRTAHNALVHVPWINDRHQKRNTGKSFNAVGLNERMRFLRYDPGTFFAPHCDGSYVRNMEAGVERYGEQSFVTFQLYLNEDFEGGTTRFVPEQHDEWEDVEETENENGSRTSNASWLSYLKPSKKARTKPRGFDVTPRAGSVLLFQHDCCHEGAVVRAGRKYAMRSDVMYTAQGPGFEYSKRPIMARQLDDLY